MKKRMRCFAGVGAVAVLLAVVTGAGAQTCKLELKRVDESSEDELQRRYSAMSGSSQQFSMAIGESGGMIDRPVVAKDRPKFSEVIKKEPAKYVAKHPFRGVAKLGSQYYGFVFDAAPEESPKKKAERKEEEGKERGAEAREGADSPEEESGEKMVVYKRLYFDFNHNGDLTDDKVVTAENTESYFVGYVCATFPCLEVAIQVDGVRLHHGPRRSSRQTEVHDQHGGRQGGRKRRVRVWLRLHLPVLVASTRESGRQVLCQGPNRRRAV